MAKTKEERLREARKRAQAAGRDVMRAAGNAIYSLNEDTLPEWAALVNPLTVFENSPEAQAVRQGLSFGWSDELAGAIGGDDAREEARREIDAFREDRPLTALGLETAGSFALPGGGVAKGGLGGLLKLRGLSPAVYGAASGAAYGAGTAEESEKRRGAIMGAGIGAGTGLAGAHVLDPLIARHYAKQMGRHIPGASADLDVFIDPDSIPGGVLYHSAPGSRIDAIMREGVRRSSAKTLGGAGDDFTFLSQGSITPQMRELVSDFAAQIGERGPVQTIAIDATKLAPGRLMLDRFNIPRKALFDMAPQLTESPANAHRLLQYAGDIPPEAILRIAPDDELAAMAGRRLPRSSLGALQRAKHSGGKVGRGEDQLRSYTPDEAIAYLKEYASQ